MSHNEDTHSKSEQVVQETSRDSSPSVTPPAAASAWQAIFSPHHNAYYFYNTETQQTTWSNPLQPSPAPSTDTTAQPSASPEPQAEAQPVASTSTNSTASSYAALQSAALAAGIDPSLAYLDPTLASLPATSNSTLPTLSSTLPTFTAKFNARTGQFTRPDARDPTHLSEYDRAKRMSEFYFDVGAWEKELAERNAGGEGQEGDAEGGRKRKRPSKKDLERFKEQKKQKKIAKTAWLRT